MTSTLSNYKCALCTLRQHWIDILCKVEAPIPSGVSLTPAQMADRETVARVLNSGNKPDNAGAIFLLNNLIKAVSSAITEGVNVPTASIYTAANTLFNYMNTNRQHLLFRNIYGEQIVDNQSYAYTYGVYLLDNKGVKSPTCLKEISVGTVEPPVASSECNSTLPPYPPVPVFPNLKAGCTKSLSMLTSIAVPNDLINWAIDTLRCNADKNDVNTHLCAADAIKSFLNGCGVCKITITKVVPGTQIILTRTSTPGTPSPETFNVPEWALNSTDKTWIFYVGDDYATNTLDVEVVRPVSNTQSTVTLANTTPNSCLSETINSSCRKATLKPAISFLPGIMTCPSNLTVKTDWLTNPNACTQDKMSVILNKPTTTPPNLPVTVTVNGNMYPFGTNSTVTVPNLPIGQHTATYIATVFGSDGTTVCDTATCSQQITVINGVMPIWKALTSAPQITMGAITNLGTPMIGAIVRPTDFTPSYEDSCGRTLAPMGTLAYKLREVRGGSLVDAITYTSSGRMTATLVLIEVVTGREITEVQVAPVINPVTPVINP